MRIFIIHGWGGNPEEGWFPSLKEKLVALGHEVMIPNMPNTDVPIIEPWVSYISKLVGEPDENTILIGHSIGTQAIMRYLDTIKKPVKATILVAGWFKLKNLESEDEWKIAKPWLETTINLDRVKQNAGKVFVFLSDDDPWVPLEENKEIFEKQLNAKVKVEIGKGHLSGEHGIFEFPQLVDTIKNLL